MASPLTSNSLRRASLDGWSPAEVASRLRHLEGLMFFDTAGNRPSSVCRPVSVITACPVGVKRGSMNSPEDQQALREELARYHQAGNDQGFPLGGLCGWVSYEGEFCFGVYPEMLVYIHESGEWWETGALSTQLREPVEEPVWVGPFIGSTTREDYLAAVVRAQEWIAAGDIYQVNLSQRFTAEVRGGSLFSLYEHLRESTPAPMAAWMALEGCEILSSSPELFLRVSGQGVETRPIKGTRPRFPHPDEDLRSAYELQTSGKEIAELVMITDLLRNDLGQVCDFGSVQVTEMLKLETLEQVHHLVSTVTGTLHEGTDAIEALAACFPGGSITGAPKKRAMEIIAELENRSRGLYCGALGWFGFNGESQFNITIRTLVREQETLTYDVGGGIVADSDPQKEYEETLHKAAGIQLALDRWRA